MLTYQDLEKQGDSVDVRFRFVKKVVEEHMGSSKYKMAVTAEKYYAKHNETIEKFQKFLYTVAGQKVPDMFSANYKLKTAFFRRFVIQQVQYVLSNGVDFEGKETKKKLGKNFDHMLQEAAKKAMVDSVAFGFWNLDHLEVFAFADTKKAPGFAPLYDQNTGALRAGVRYWKPSEDVFRYTLYEEDGLTEYIQEGEAEGKELEPKRSYIRSTTKAPADREAIISGRNYGKLPIFPMYANDLHQSDLEGHQEGIDCYDFIKSGLANDIDDASGFFWILKNSGGMDDMDLARFVERMKTVRAATVDADEGVEADAHTLNIPTEAREKMLTILENDLYKDFQVVNVAALSAGNKTATEINAAYQPMDDKSGDFEFCIREFIDQILDLVGIQDTYSFRWNRIANQTEEVQMIMTAYPVLGDELALKKLPFLTPEESEARIKELTKEETDRFNGKEPPEE